MTTICPSVSPARGVFISLTALLLSACGGGGGDASSLPLVSIADVSIAEGTDGGTPLLFTVTLSAPANGNVTVDYATADGTALDTTRFFPSADYQEASGTLTIAAGTTEATITVMVGGDRTPESDETLSMTLSNVSANATLARASAVATIVDDDAFGAVAETGITQCSGFAAGTTTDAHPLPCPQATHPGQDGDYLSADPSFSLVKLGTDGKPLVLDEQFEDYATVPWACVHDRVTGLVWEVKTDDGGLHDKDWAYTWYNSSGSNDGGDPGTAGTSSNLTCGAPITVAAGCDTEKFVAAVNAEGWCGAHDWRLPTRRELASLVDSGGVSAPTIDAVFANTIPGLYWSSTPYKVDVTNARTVYFQTGTASFGQKSIPRSVRLVRGGS